MMGTVRTAAWTVDKNREVLPDAPLFGGVQGEDNATQVEFHLSGDCPLLEEKYQLHIEYVDATGAWDCTEVLKPDQDGRVCYVVPLAWTQHGGISTVRLVATAPDQTAYTMKGYLKFDHRDTAKRAEKTVVQTLVKDILERLRQLKEDFFARVDPELDATSENPVQNRVVAESVEYLESNMKGNADLIDALNTRMNNLKLIPGPQGVRGSGIHLARINVATSGTQNVTWSELYSDMEDVSVGDLVIGANGVIAQITDGSSTTVTLTSTGRSIKGPKGEDGDTAGFSVTSDGKGHVVIESVPRFKDFSGVIKRINTLESKAQDQDVLIVTLDGAAHADCGVQRIWEHAKIGGNVLLEIYEGCYIPLSYVAEDVDAAYFSYVADDLTLCQWTITGQGDVAIVEDYGLASMGDIGDVRKTVTALETQVGDIDTALDEIIAMQEGMFIITFRTAFGEAFAVSGMTWAEWCDSKFNAYGWTYDEDGVYDDAGDLVYMEDPGNIGYDQKSTDIIREGERYSTR